MSTLTELRLIGAFMPVGAVRRDALCPWCGKEKGSFFIKRFEGSLFYQCYRATCGHRGNIQIDVDRQPQSFQAKSHLQDFYRETHQLPADIKKDLFIRYELDDAVLRLHDVNMSYIGEDEALHIPVRGKYGKLYAHWLKTWPPASRPKKNDLVKVSEQFNGLYFADQPATSQPSNRLDYGVIVEDPLSAIKAEELGFTGIALLGTTLKVEQIAAIQRRCAKIILALDPGTERLMAHYMHKFGGYFTEWHNVYLPDDLKRVPFVQLKSYFKHWMGAA